MRILVVGRDEPMENVSAVADRALSVSVVSISLFPLSALVTLQIPITFGCQIQTKDTFDTRLAPKVLLSI